MLIAAFSDVHGNLRALEAVLAQIRRLRPDLVLNLGDCVSGPLWPRETCELLQSLSIPTVRGNHDRVVAQGRPEAMGASDRFARERLTDAQRDWLLNLPFDLSLEGLRCFHANPRDDMGYLLEEVADGTLRLADPAAILARLEAPPPLLLCGHSHQPRIVCPAPGVTIVNPGSVGWQAYPDAGPPPHVSETGSPHARYAVVTTGRDGIRTELIAVEYDWEAAARTALAHGRPGWAHALRTGRVG